MVKRRLGRRELAPEPRPLVVTVELREHPRAPASRWLQWSLHTDHTRARVEQSAWALFPDATSVEVREAP